MIRSTIDEYLDGALDTAGHAEVEKALARDPEAGRLLTQIKAERALRAAAFESYMPSAQEASALAEQVLDSMAAPVGHVNHLRWIRWTAGVAAVLAIAAGSFGVGRATAPTQVVTKEVEVTNFAVWSQNDPQVYRTKSPEAYNKVLQQLEQESQRNKALNVADYTVSGKM